jgi:insertion element IS1 protein InsB
MLSPCNITQCSHCQSTEVVKNGKTRHGHQRYLCHVCHKSRVIFYKKPKIEDNLQLYSYCKRAFLERLSLLGISRVFAISYYKVFHLGGTPHLSLFCLQLPSFRNYVAKVQADDVLEFDELCGFCGNKKNKQWVWAALSRKTRQVVAYVIGDRSEKTFLRLLRKIPLEYLRLKSYSDYWQSYNILKSKKNHTLVGKDSGETNHIERFWATLRNRVNRYVRKSLSFSRSLKYMH